MPENTFGQDLDFLNQHLETVVLRNKENAAVVVAPEYQGRTMISTNGGDQGSSYGFINYGAVESDVICLLYTSPSPRDQRGSRMPSSA